MARRSDVKRPPPGRAGRSAPPAPSPTVGRRRWAAAGLILLALAVPLGAAWQWQVSTSRSTARSDGALVPVPLPPMTALSPTVREQISAAHRRAEALAAAPAAEQAAAWGELGQILLAYGLDAAEPALRNAVTRDPAAFRWPYFLGRYFHLRQDIPQARAAYEAALALRPDDVPTRLRLAQLAQDAGDLDQAADQVAAVLDRDQANAYAHFLDGEIAAARGDDEAAVAAWSRALELQPTASRLNYLLAMAQRRLGRMDEAAALLGRRGDVPVRMEDPLAAEVDALRLSGQVLVQQAGVAEREGRLQDARQILERAVALDPQDGAARQNLGLLRYRGGDLPAARADLEAAISLEPRNARFQVSLAVILEAAGQREAAEAALREALRLDSLDADVQVAMADFYRRGDRCAEAVAPYEAAIELAPSRALLRVQQAVCRERLGDSRAALEGLIQARKDFPEDPSVADALARVLAAASDPTQRDPAAALALIRPYGEAAAAGIDVRESLAMALAAGGRFPEAIAVQEKALALAKDRPDWQQALAANLERYRGGQAATAAWPDFLYRPSR